MRRSHALLSPIVLLALVAALLPVAATAKISSKKAASGLKEALSVGTGEAVEILGQVDGYLERPEVRIEVPEKLELAEKALRTFGQDEVVDEFVLGLNRAAEAAAPLAREIFLDAIREMTFEDARKILKGDDHAATAYLEEKSRGRLRELFRPVIEEKLDEVGATKAFNRFVGKYGRLPLREEPVFDLPEYATDGALDGLFYMIAKQEEKIRNDVVARTSDLLKEVFGSLDEGGKKAGEKKKPWWKRL
jgi:hypothetical protein